MRLEIGQTIITNYETGPYEIVGIIRGCDCPDFLDEINMIDPPKSKEHTHLTVRGEDGKTYWLNWYDENTLENVNRPDDRIILLPNKMPVQLSIF